MIATQNQKKKVEYSKNPGLNLDPKPLHLSRGVPQMSSHSALLYAFRSAMGRGFV